MASQQVFDPRVILKNSFDTSVWSLQVEELLPAQPGVRPARHGPDDLHDGDGQPAPGARWLHARGAERAARPVAPQPGLLPALHAGAGQRKY